uniref:Uncharacterized protein n=1 Tax=viral metagenome TaxID=1070528 RepID=A0A6H1ZUI2_9ZZZZ
MLKLAIRRFSTSRENFSDTIIRIQQNKPDLTTLRIAHITLQELMVLNSALARNSYITEINFSALNDLTYYGANHFGTMVIITNEIKAALRRNQETLAEKIDLHQFLKESKK